MPISILVSGASGFVGGAVQQEALARGMSASALTRRHDGRYEVTRVPAGAPSLPGVSDLAVGLHGVDCLVHCAGRAHVMDDRADDPLQAFRASNVDGTIALAREAVAAGVRRFVFISSIKVNGDATVPGKPFRPGDTPRPSDPYGVSKCEAEEALRKLSAETTLELVIIRPVLVYGPDVKANFLAMMRWLKRQVPLPLGLVANRRSLVGLHNLTDLILTTVSHPAAPGQTFLVSDGEDLSTPALLKRTAIALGTTARLLPVPPSVLRALAIFVGRQASVSRLCGWLQVDASHTTAALGWTPSDTVDAELARTARHFLAKEARR